MIKFDPFWTDQIQKNKNKTVIFILSVNVTTFYSNIFWLVRNPIWSSLIKFDQLWTNLILKNPKQNSHCYPFCKWAQRGHSKVGSKMKTYSVYASSIQGRFPPLAKYINMYEMDSISSLLDRCLPSWALMLANLGFPGFASASIWKTIDKK